MKAMPPPAKKIGADFAEGKMTLPATLMLEKVDDATRRRLLQNWRDGRDDAFADVLRLVTRHRCARRYT